MAPISRLAFIAMLFSAAFVNAAPADTASSPTHELYKRGVNIITSCTVKGTVAITFDDGPYLYTSDLLDILKKKGVKVTFFMNGDNYSKITSSKYAAVVKRAYKEGHQIASHTWDHKDLTTLSKSGITKEMTKLETAFKSIIGVRPTYMRPPYGSVNSLVLSTLSKLGYKIVTWDEDTEDWKHPKNPAASYNLYKKVLTSSGVKKAGHIFLEHDVNHDTALVLAPEAIDLALKKGYKVVPVGTCLGASKSSWYTK
ncbi:hypothetical protein BGZ80_001295 [Entomortierella chlamydospora]|uniref:NodB homology domain-containing protein n=1 Tax=Entomortierella chlamydospora TaxID=101097 RepID=A0A9P6MR99_9FUNG|nr:hypothetical protein BGZ79_001068 [Entomortierella chlamydospora]KAG0010648.1 hypothetical protein BGZ80_001295 [Entomortierella chlamydospora]